MSPYHVYWNVFKMLYYITWFTFVWLTWLYLIKAWRNLSFIIMTVEFIQTIPNVVKIRKQLNFHPFNNCRYNFQMFAPSDTISMTLTWTKKTHFFNFVFFKFLPTINALFNYLTRKNIGVDDASTCQSFHVDHPKQAFRVVKRSQCCCRCCST
jgi:hypothetical protein